jgi:hypothetical protein
MSEHDDDQQSGESEWWAGIAALYPPDEIAEVFGPDWRSLTREEAMASVSVFFRLVESKAGRSEP